MNSPSSYRNKRFEIFLKAALRLFLEGSAKVIDEIAFLFQLSQFSKKGADISPPKTLEIATSVQRVLVISAHADDEALGCFGAIAAYQRQGAVVDWIVVVDGRNATGGFTTPETMATLRKEEAREVAAAFNWNLVDWIGEKSPLVSSDALEKRLAEHVELLSPDIVYAPFSYNHHFEHRAVSVLAAKVVPADVEMLFYAIQTPLTPVFATTIFAQADVARLTYQALSFYRSQYFMSRSFRAAVALQCLEGALYSTKVPTISFCRVMSSQRVRIIEDLALSAEGSCPRKPNRMVSMTRDYQILFKQASEVFLALKLSKTEEGLACASGN